MSNSSTASKRRPATSESRSTYAPRYHVGERICIRRGALEGAAGFVHAIHAGRRYVLALDGFPPGIYMAVEETSLIASAK